MTSYSTDHRWQRWAAVMSALALLIALMPTAGAAPEHKSFTATIEPTSAIAGLETPFTVTITNTSDQTKLGAARIHLPFDFDLISVELDRAGWVHSVFPGGIEVNASSPSQGLPPGESLVVILTIAPLQEPGSGDPTYPIEIEARQANHFNGTGNELNYVGADLAITITGSAVRCVDDCDTTFAESGTTATVMTSCTEENCGILSLDLDPDYCLVESCVGNAAFWNPPNTDELVHLDLKLKAENIEWWEVDDLTFFVSKDDEGNEFEECTRESEDEVEVDYYSVSSSEEEPWCTYTLEAIKKDGEVKFIIVNASIDPNDPRGFVS